MGKQSSRMIYRGKDHKDIFFRGKYHDAMYLGYELLWHKIRQEGYYVLISMNGESYAQETLDVHVFDEKTGNIEKVLGVKRNPYSDAYYVSLLSVMDTERIYLSTLGTDALIAASIDGIHYGNTNLDFFENQDMYIGVNNYYSNSENQENGSLQKVNYIWGKTSYGIGTYWIGKRKITINGNDYSVESKNIDTGLSTRSVRFNNYWESNYLICSEYGKSKIALHVKEVTNYPLTEQENGTTTVKYYDAETETSGEIVEFINSRYVGVSVTEFNCVNDIYIFFVREEYGKEKIGRLYVYYSSDGINYSNFLILRKTIGVVNGYYNSLPVPMHVLYRNGMYYIYCLPEEDRIGTPNVLFLTTDFKHFSKKYIPCEMEIDGKTFDTVNGLQPKEMNAMHCRYFYNGEPSYPEDGILAATKVGTVYIDNMFFRESKGNKILSLS